MIIVQNYRHLVLMTGMDRKASDTVLSERCNTATGTDLSSSTVDRRFSMVGIVARMPLRQHSLSNAVD